MTADNRPIQRTAPTPRPPGRTVLTAAECGNAVASSAQSLYFVEAGDGGGAVNTAQAQAVFRALDEASAGTGALVSVFVHGWQHSAAPGDSYVCDYAKLIHAVETMETQAARASGRPAGRCARCWASMSVGRESCISKRWQIRQPSETDCRRRTGWVPRVRCCAS
jgi:hypothetical protein